MNGQAQNCAAQTLTNGSPKRKPLATPILVSKRIDMPCVVAGFDPPPPCRVHLKFLPSGDRWILLVLSGPGMPAKVAHWLLSFGPSEINIAPGIAPRVLRATFDALPPAWKDMLSKVTVHYVDLTSEGSASIFVADALDKVERFVEVLRVESSVVRARKTLQGAARVELTARQLEVLALAVALGYYETPHQVSLRGIANKLRLSVGATSELLRRGESLIITSYVDAMTESGWTQLNESW